MARDDINNLNNKVDNLLQSCNILSGIGSQILQKLNNLNIFSIYDLLLHLPFRYQDRTRITTIQDLRLNQPAVVQGILIESHWLQGKKRIFHCKISDGTGELSLRFFHMPPYLQKRLQYSQTIQVFGEIKLKAYGFEMIHPEIEFQPSTVHEFFTPWYPSTQGIHQNQWRKYIHSCFSSFENEIENLEWLPKSFLETHQLTSLPEALKLLHFPSPDKNIDELMYLQHPARKRLALEELIAYSISSQRLKHENNTHKALRYAPNENLSSKLIKQLPFSLTDAQCKVLHEIQLDLNQSHPMLRLLQGDVGSGKTIVCALASLSVLAQHHQVALMAPTDLLSEQHYINIKNWLEPHGFNIKRLNRTTPAKEKKQTLIELENGTVHFVIGTHALFQDKVRFKHLGLVIIDEQHRFGVLQRLKLAEKGPQDFYPHQLFVTATPIPRTLAMTQFSHFDISILDQLPQGRKPIQTAVMSEDKRDIIIQRLKDNLRNNGQIYWVCTRIEQDDEEQQQATEAITQYLKEQIPQAKIGMVHGKLKTHEKEQVMSDFKAGKYDILVATTVIEVGVDVPNANIMIIENAERLGLSQLHQLRGRVGRGQSESFCVLLYTPPLGQIGQQRLAAIRQSIDGFWLAEEDMKIRGYGEVLGTQQSGFNEFRLAKMPEHYPLLKIALEHAKTITNENPHQAQKLLTYWYNDAYKFLQA